MNKSSIIFKEIILTNNRNQLQELTFPLKKNIIFSVTNA